MTSLSNNNPQIYTTLEYLHYNLVIPQSGFNESSLGNRLTFFQENIEI